MRNLLNLVVFTLKKLLSLSPKNKLHHFEQEIPRYPPFAKGLPLASTSELLKSQSEMLKKIRLEVGTPSFEKNYLPCITAYCNFVHLLPASEYDHHRGAGGLFRHGLEVAFHSLIYSKYKLFDTTLPPSERVSNAPKWHLASFLSGLVHDIGKPLSDYQVISEDGHHIWNPFSLDIVQWGEEVNIDKYFLHWQKGRYRKHESLSSVIAKRIISDAALSYLSTTGNYIIRNMFECITNKPDYDNKIYELVKKADHFSSEQDVKTASLRGDDVNLALPLDKYILDSIKLLNINNDWGLEFTSTPPLIFINTDLFLTAKAIKRVTEKLADSKIPGVPWEQKALTESLISTGFAMARETVDGSESNMWALLKQGEERITWASKLSEWSLIFPDKPETNSSYRILSEEQISLTNNSTNVSNGKDSDSEPNQTQESLNVSNGKDLDSEPNQTQESLNVSNGKDSDSGVISHINSFLKDVNQSTILRACDQGIAVFWEKIPLHLQKDKELIDKIKPCLVENSVGDYSHILNSKPVIIVKPPFTKKLTTVKGVKSKNKRKPVSKNNKLKAGIIEHRPVPKDFDPNSIAKKTVLNVSKQDKKERNIPHNYSRKVSLLKRLCKDIEAQPFLNASVNNDEDFKKLINKLKAQYRENKFVLSKIDKIKEDNNEG